MRRGPSQKRKTVPDPVFDSNLVSQLTNQILQDGKKDKARTIVYGAMSIIEKKRRRRSFRNIKKCLREC